MRKIGTITIGQSPRNDILSVMKRYLPQDVEVLGRGALDGLDLPAVAALKPKPGEPTLVTVMRDGTGVTVTHHNVVPLMNQGVEALADEGAEFVVTLCSAEFSEVRSDRVVVVDSGNLLQGIVRSLADGVKLGVIQPSPDQVTEREAGSDDPWHGLDVVMTSASPYAEPEDRARQWQQAAESLKESRVGLVYLNCMGMDETMRQVVRRVTQKPVLLASSMLARTVDELLGRSEVEADLALSRSAAP